MTRNPQQPGWMAEEDALRGESWGWTRMRLLRRYVAWGDQFDLERAVLLSHGYFAKKGIGPYDGEVVYIREAAWTPNDWQPGDNEEAVRARIIARQARERAQAEHDRELEARRRQRAETERRRRAEHERLRQEELERQQRADDARRRYEAEQQLQLAEQQRQLAEQQRQEAERQRREEEKRRLETELIRQRADEERRWHEDAAWRATEAAQRREQCPYCTDDVATGDPYCRWCGTRLAALPPVGDWRSPQLRTGFGECRLGFYGPKLLREQHNLGRPYLTKEAADAHAAWCFDFSGRAREANVPRELLEMQLNVQSELADCGYRITGLSRDQRWRVLVAQAIPQLGRSAVIEHLEWLVHTRSGQARDYSHAIREWEYDLMRVRNHS